MNLFFSLLIFILTQHGQFTGRVTAVIDGDTIDVLHDEKSERIRLNGIDCPEKSQAFGAKAKKVTSDMIFGRAVTVKSKEIDRYGRTIADVYLSDGTWLNRALIEQGLAWHYKRYSNDEDLAKAEIRARAKGLNIWSQPYQVAPWDFRKLNR